MTRWHPPGANGSIFDGQCFSWNYEQRVNLEFVPKPGAFLAHSQRVVETEKLGSEVRHADTAPCAGTVFAHQGFFSRISIYDRKYAITFPQGCFNGIHESAGDTLTGHYPVDHKMNTVLFPAVQFDVFFEAPAFSINKNPYIASSPQCREEVRVGSLSVPQERSGYQQPGPF